MNLLVFGVGDWNSRSDAEQKKLDYNEWYNRIQHFLNYPQKTFIATGTYSDPNICPIRGIDVIQIGIPYTKQYTSLWSYYRVGFFTGIYYALLNPGWDLLIHCQTRMLLGVNLIPHLKEFLDRPEQIMAPKWASLAGSQVEVALMAMKPDAVRKYATSSLRSSLIENSDKPYSINSEHECFLMFHDSWYNPFPEVFSTRKMGVNFKQNANRDFELDMKTFLNLPFVSGNRHCSKSDLKMWIDKHPMAKT